MLQECAEDYITACRPASLRHGQGVRRNASRKGGPEVRYVDYARRGAAVTQAVTRRLV
jgi:hypothetical protein